MLLSFTVSNFRSFREEQTLSMVASKRYPDHPDHLTPLPELDESLLPAALIYGANGAGKSNLVKALDFVRDLVLQGTPPDWKIQREPFLLGGIDPGTPTTFEIRFLSEKNVFTYGLKLTDSIISEEWLDIMRGSRSINLFERITKVEVGPDNKEKHVVTMEAGNELSKGALGNHDKLVAMTKAFSRANQLFLSSLRENLSPQEFGPLIQSVLKWFASMVIVHPNANFRHLVDLVAKDSSFAEFASEFLSSASTGVSKLSVQNMALNEGAPGILGELVREILGNAQIGETRTKFIDGFGDLVAERGGGGKVTLRHIRAEHKTEDNKVVALPFEVESDGTQRLTHLLPALFQLKKDQRVFVIDEIDRSLHPLLARKFIQFFLQVCKGHESQIIVTTHESNLMDLELLRRDELWFAEKNPAGATTLYSLSDFKVRTDLKIDKGYLYGRFGAIPFLGNLDRLIKQLNAG